MSMRKQFVDTVERTLIEDSRLVLLLGDIGVFGFRKAFERCPDRAYNIGILEQSTVGLAAGLAKTEFIPLVHTIAPFLIERSFEQLKIDFCYQKLGGNFVSVGASYDYAALGCTHHCPGDIGLLMNIPGMEIVLPGTAGEFDLLFRQSYSDGMPTYYRLSERENPISYDVTFGKAEIIKRGASATVIAIGTTLKPVLEATNDLDVTVLYYTTLIPFDTETLLEQCASSRILLCEPYYNGCLASEIHKTLGQKPIALDCIGVPRRFLTNYGNVDEQDESIGLTPNHIRSRLEMLING
jgi:transketolase